MSATRMRRLRASIQALCAFEVAARLQSFTRAADELCITQGGVSRQIRALETALGTPLFVRGHRSLQTTPAGQMLLEAASQGLGQLAQAMEAVQAQGQASAQAPQLTVGMSMAFAQYWLMPRLQHLHAAHPTLDLRVVCADRDFDGTDPSIDMAVRYGQGDWPGLHCTHLFDDAVYPVCSPAFVQAHGPLDTPADLLRVPLLHIDRGGEVWRQTGWQAGWSRWLRAQGIAAAPHGRSLKLSSYPLIVEAALAGQGVALGWHYATDALVQQGRLLRPMAAELRPEQAYYLVTPHAPGTHAACDALRAWVLSELA